jgi:hypothetical protein
MHELAYKMAAQLHALLLLLLAVTVLLSLAYELLELLLYGHVRMLHCPITRRSHLTNCQRLSPKELPPKRSSCC